jgi:hypothetical protein
MAESKHERSADAGAEGKNVDHCGDCRFWHVRLEPVGTCRRFPPTAMSAAGHPAWVVTTHEDWCGEFASPPPEKK